MYILLLLPFLDWENAKAFRKMPKPNGLNQRDITDITPFTQLLPSVKWGLEWDGRD